MKRKLVKTKNLTLDDKNRYIKQTRDYGQFFTNQEVSQSVANQILTYIKPKYIIEPFVGTGSLIQPFLSLNNQLILNDISTYNLLKLQKSLTNLTNVNIYSNNFVTTPTDEIIRKWDIPRNTSDILFYTNPPFGTVSTNKLARQKSEKGNSYQIQIDYGNMEKRYGKGDLVLPAIGKMIDIDISCNDINIDGNILSFYYLVDQDCY